jgi:hypothetical protein
MDTSMTPTTNSPGSPPIVRTIRPGSFTRPRTVINIRMVPPGFAHEL